MYLPRIEAASAPGGPLSQQQPFSNAVVFAVDDEQNNLDLLRRTLAQVCKLETFQSSEKALAAARQKTPDLLLLDFRMPEMNGTELLAQFRAAGIDSAVVFLTAFPEEEALQRVIKEEEVFWVSAKPYDPELLRSQVNMALSLARVRSRNKGRPVAKQC